MKKSLIALALIATLSLAGCTTAWLTTFDGYLQIAGPVLIQILDIIAISQGKAIDQNLVAKVNQDSAAVKSLAASVSAAAASNPVGICAQFNTAVATLAGDYSEIAVLANVGPNTSTTIVDALGIAQAAIQEVEAPIAACANAPSPAAARAVFSTKVTVTSPSDVVTKFNACVDRKHRVHIHSAVTRYATLGLLK